MRQTPFTRITIIAAVEQFASVGSRADFDKSLMRLDVDQRIPLGDARSVSAKWPLLAQEILRDPSRVISTPDGPMSIGEAAVRLAVAATQQLQATTEKDRFLRALGLDGYVVTFDENPPHRPLLRASLPAELALPAVDDEVHQLLKTFRFQVAAAHLDQAIDAHTRGDWAAANAQIRTYLESLFTDIAHQLRPQEAAEAKSFENIRQLLGEIGFFSKERNEWTPKGDGYINGLFKMLHTEGSHPGLSDEERSTFRLHVVLVTSRTFLRRLALGKQGLPH
jgi:hypothetical protein